jgi:hypothetical protein
MRPRLTAGRNGKQAENGHLKRGIGAAPQVVLSMKKGSKEEWEGEGYIERLKGT